MEAADEHGEVGIILSTFFMVMMGEVEPPAVMVALLTSCEDPMIGGGLPVTIEFASFVATASASFVAIPAPQPQLRRATWMSQRLASLC